MSGPQTLRIIYKVVYTRSDHTVSGLRRRNITAIWLRSPAFCAECLMFRDALFLRTGTFELQHRESSWTLLSSFCLEKMRKKCLQNHNSWELCAGSRCQVSVYYWYWTRGHEKCSARLSMTQSGSLMTARQHHLIY